MSDRAQVLGTRGAESKAAGPPSQPCVMLVLGASGDLTRRLLVPALYNLACDGLPCDRFALLGAAMDPLTTDAFRRRLGEDIQRFHTRHAFDPPAWDDLVARFHYQPAAFDDLGAFQALKAEVARLDARHGYGGNAGSGSSWRSPSAPTWPPPGG